MKAALLSLRSSPIAQRVEKAIHNALLWGTKQTIASFPKQSDYRTFCQQRAHVITDHIENILTLHLTMYALDPELKTKLNRLLYPMLQEAIRTFPENEQSPQEHSIMWASYMLLGVKGILQDR